MNYGRRLRQHSLKIPLSLNATKINSKISKIFPNANTQCRNIRSKYHPQIFEIVPCLTVQTNVYTVVDPNGKLSLAGYFRYRSKFGRKLKWPVIKTGPNARFYWCVDCYKNIYAFSTPNVKVKHYFGCEQTKQQFEPNSTTTFVMPFIDLIHNNSVLVGH